MIAILAILLITLAAAAFTVFVLWHALSDKDRQKVFTQPNARGLFSHPESENNTAVNINEESMKASSRRAELINRARQGDIGAISDAHATGSVELYNEALDAFIEHAPERQGALTALVNHIGKSNELRANIGLARKVLANWKAAPDRRSTIEVLHIAALSDDAATYQKAVEDALGFFQSGRLAGISAEELLALVESEYWVLDSEARLGGAGFALKRTLADVRRELAAATPAR